MPNLSEAFATLRRQWSLDFRRVERVVAALSGGATLTQLVAVEPGRSYRLRAFAKATDFTTRSGIKLQVVVPGALEQSLAETQTVSGTTGDWVRLETPVTIPANTSLVMLKVRREPAVDPEGNLSGKVWLDEVTLQ